MDIETLMGKSGAYVVSERHRQTHGVPEEARLTKPSLAISYMFGAGAKTIASDLARALQETESEEPGTGGGAGSRTWEVFDHQLIEKALQQEHWPKKLAESVLEEKRFIVDELVDDLFSLRPPSWVLVPKLTETVTNLAVNGHAILVGHGATIITAKLPNVFHVRLTGSLPRRIERIEKNLGISHEEAVKLVKTIDHKREKYAKAFFHAHLEDELHHDLSINTDRISESDAVAVIAQAARRFFSTL